MTLPAESPEHRPQAIIGNLGEREGPLFIPDEDILKLWDQRSDTLTIDRWLQLPESHVANRLPRILERRRQDHQWTSVA